MPSMLAGRKPGILLRRYLDDSLVALGCVQDVVGGLCILWKRAPHEACGPEPGSGRKPAAGRA